jgi:demethylmenaquinone methyltransferase/2-methoxy-6-polyprenyl-1,4-benzoquinol methylase
MNTLITFAQDSRWRRIVAESLALDPHARSSVLDVGTGTGKLAEAVRRAKPKASVIGVDFTLPMLRQAQRELLFAGADALKLPFSDAQFDAVVSGFVMRNLADVPAGIGEQARVLRPGGQLVVLETTPGPPNLWRPLFRLYFRRLVPLLGQLIAGDESAYTYLPESTLAFLEPDRLAGVLREAGLVDVQIRRLAVGSVAVTTARKA